MAARHLLAAATVALVLDRPCSVTGAAAKIVSLLAAVDLTPRQLFLDTEQISASAGVELRLHRPYEEQGFAMQYDEPWENLRSFGYNSVLDNGTHVLLYYMIKSTWPLSPAECAAAGTLGCVNGWYTNAYTCVAISSDGTSFAKPALGLVEINRSTANNCIWPPGRPGHLAAKHEPGTVFIDERPGGVPADQKFKMIATWGGGPAGAPADGTYTFASSDGLRWRPLAQRPASGVSGTQHVAFWDPNHGVYVDYRRSYSDYTVHQPWNWNATCAVCVEPHRCGLAHAGARQVGRCTSDDFITYPNCSFLGRPGQFGPQRVNNRTSIVFSFDRDDAPCLDVYTNQVYLLPGSQHYLMFPSFFEHFPGPPSNPSENDGLWSEVRLAHSRDGLNWTYVGGDRQAWLRRGPQRSPPDGGMEPTAGSSWDSGMIAAVRGVVQLAIGR